MTMRQKAWIAFPESLGTAWAKLRWPGGRNKLCPRVQVLGDVEGGVVKTCANLDYLVDYGKKPWQIE
jgi:hypothetical protein